MTSDVRINLASGVLIPFTYEVIWKPSDVEFDRRFEKYLDPTFFQHRVGSLSEMKLSVFVVS